MTGSLGIPRERLLRGGKQDTLFRLAARLGRSSVPYGVGVEWREWRTRREHVLERLARELPDGLLAVRSDRIGEDARPGADAGRYLTRLGVRADDAATLADSMDRVFASYRAPHDGDRVFVQRQVARVRHAAVVLGRALPDGAPYIVVSIAPGPRSDRVTSGDAAVETWYLARDRRADAVLPEHCRRCLDTYLEVEAAAAQACDVELVIDDEEKVWLLQARALPAMRVPAVEIAARRREAEATLADAGGALLGMMPDWNPAELIGEHPRPLARTLFERLIARRAWRIARARLGYARVDAKSLLQMHAGRPYVDVRASLGSLLPAGLDAALAERLLDAQCARLRAHPGLHDKIEFEIAFAAPVCALATQFSARYADVLPPAHRRAFEQALLALAPRLFDAATTARLIASFERDLAGAPEHAASTGATLTRLELRTAVRFAMAARQAFSVEALLRSAVTVGALDETLLEATRHHAAAALHAIVGNDDGHMRAGTFEIAAPPRRAWMCGTELRARPSTATAMPSLEASAARRLRAALRDARIDVDPETLLALHANAVLARELGKHALARGVSFLLDALAARAAVRGLDVDAAGWLGVDDLLDPTLGPTTLAARADIARETHALEAMLRMPLLLDTPHLDVVHRGSGTPNYLGAGHVHGRVVVVDPYTHPDEVPIHALIAIASANPGFDWIFPRRPAALVTAFGGPNSHMAIRCAQANVPALLGVGPDAFDRIVSAGHISIDFGARTWSPS